VDAPQLQRVVVDFRNGELVARVLYRSEDGPSPATPATLLFDGGGGCIAIG
jgi:hypothetical protein